MKDFSLALAAADALAAWSLAGVTDKQGVPLIEHVRRVSQRVAARGGSHEQQIAALLHDCLEDSTRLDYHAIRRIFGQGVADIVYALTRRRDHENYNFYIACLGGTPASLLPKWCDLDDNLDEDGLRGSPISEEKLARDARYRRAREQVLAMMRDRGLDTAPNT